MKGLPPNQDPLEGEMGEDLIVELSRTQLLKQSLKAQKFAELRSLWRHLRRHVVDLSQRISLLEAQVKWLPPKQEPLELPPKHEDCRQMVVGRQHRPTRLRYSARRLEPAPRS